MDFAPVHKTNHTVSTLPTDRDLERRKLAQQESARREAIRRQIAEQNRLKNLNQRRIEAAKLELSEYQAAEEKRNRALEAERQKAIERQRNAQREAIEQRLASRKAAELEARKRILEEQKRRERAMQEMQRREAASKIKVTRQVSLKPRPTDPFSTQRSAQSSVVQAAASATTSSIHRSAIASSLRAAGDTKVVPSSRIQVVASPSRKLFGRIRPAGPSRSSEQSSSAHSNEQPKTKTDDLEDLFLSAFEEEPKSSKDLNPKNSRASAAPDTSENNMNYVLGGRSPFINTDKIEKRPLSDSRKENTTSRTDTRISDYKDVEPSQPVKPRKNVYAKRETAKKSTNKGTMIVEDRPKGIGISLAVAITLMIILGTIVGALVYFAFFQ